MSAGSCSQTLHVHPRQLLPAAPCARCWRLRPAATRLPQHCHVCMPHGRASCCLRTHWASARTLTRHTRQQAASVWCAQLRIDLPMCRCPPPLLCCLCRTILTRTFDGLSKGYKGSLVPVLSTENSLFDAVRKLDHLQGSVLPTSSRKISHCKVRCRCCCHCRCGCCCVLLGSTAVRSAQAHASNCSHCFKRAPQLPSVDPALPLPLPPCPCPCSAPHHHQALFDRYIDANSLVLGLEKEEAYVLKSKRMTPKMFAHSIKQKCIANPQRIVLPEVSMYARAGVGPA